MTEPLPAHDTRKRLLPRVNPHVSVQISSLDEPFTAFFAAVWFLARVNPHVVLHIGGVTEAFAANSTNIWLPSVDITVDLLTPGCREGWAYPKEASWDTIQFVFLTNLSRVRLHLFH